ncbi:MAG: adenosylmethionine decarboxylase [Candidatus Brocadiales bacterium]
MEAFGRHLILEMWDCDRSIVNDPGKVEEIVRKAATEAKATVMGIVSHKFDPSGVTCLAILAESHLSVHTWPKEGYVAADIFTCGRTAAPEPAAEYLIGAFKPKDSKTLVLTRGDSSVSELAQHQTV